MIDDLAYLDGDLAHSARRLDRLAELAEAEPDVPDAATQRLSASAERLRRDAAVTTVVLSVVEGQTDPATAQTMTDDLLE